MEDWLDPLYDADGMRASDSWAIDTAGVASLDLMEAAGAALADAAIASCGPGPARVVCGKGNTGGDGLVAARLMAAAGLDVETLLLWPADELSPDAATNLERLDGHHREVDREIDAALGGSGVVVDAIFGTGFSGAPRAPADAAIDAINACGSPVVAADVASGVDASTGEVARAAVKADLTVTFHAAKLGHRIHPGKGRTGELRVADIGIPAGAPAAPAGGSIRDAVLDLLPRRGPQSTKFTSGQVVLVGGSRGLTGAVCLAAEAAIRAGAGYATVAVPADLEPIFEVKLTEVMSRGFAGADGRLAAADADAIVSACSRASAVVLGSGLGRDEDSLELARRVAAGVEAPLVIDADGLNAHADAPQALAGRGAPTVLTPHAGELSRLLGVDSDAIGAARLARAREAAELTDSLVVLKGDDTLVVDHDSLAVAGLSSPALATAGTGDTLAGTIAALIARGLEPFAAAACAVHACTRAGRIATARLGGADSVVAGDVIAALPRALVAGPLE
ncbi:MAG: ADP-dependent NAD(P)H-hydrate dehydratase / NAD(P)H-hydrate epimerase [Solirubrobacterales bacterium]|nr:ADP-dependent NAD(P)H-hydrate dehydratase / NAD(P)H-hydrate epimerase [Solirubrobacterales bacterium]